MPSRPAPNSASDIGSGTGTVLALAVPLTAAGDEASEVPKMLADGVTLEKPKLMASGLPRAEAGITLEVKVTLSPGAEFEAVKVSPVPAPKTESLNVPLR